jgi:hypothetical protein
MTATAHSVQFHEASCRHCRRSFAIPLLGDQNHGQFIFYGEKGSVFGYLSSLEDPAWVEITERLGRAGLFTSSRSRTDIDHFQRVVAACADPISGQKLVLLPVCPGCRSRSVEYGASKPLDVREVPGVTFCSYQNLSDQSRMEALRRLWEECT